jgi:nifR3 family TIM-barrel protein
MKIGNIELGDKPLFLAPMEDVTDPSFRYMCKRFGADVVTTEFISSDGLIRDAWKSRAKLNIDEAERPVGIQIYGHLIEPMVEAARIAETARPDFIDINFGCPVKKVAGKGAGAGMLQNVPGILEITKAVVEAVPDTPVTVKTRLAWSEEQLVLPDGTPFIADLAERLQDCGIKALTIHGRTRAQMYTGSADWTNIGKVKANPRMCIPIIGNGDITSAEETTQAFERYGVDAVMIGRATFGRPWIFHEIAHPERPLSLDEKVDILKQQVVISIERAAANLQNTLHGKNPELCGIRHVRRHLAATPLFKGIPNYRDTRIAMLRAEKKEEVFDLIEKTREMLKTGCTEDI